MFITHGYAEHISPYFDGLGQACGAVSYPIALNRVLTWPASSPHMYTLESEYVIGRTNIARASPNNL